MKRRYLWLLVLAALTSPALGPLSTTPASAAVTTPMVVKTSGEVVVDASARAYREAVASATTASAAVTRATCVAKSLLDIGDSLSWETSPTLQQIMWTKCGWTVNFDTVPGTSTCDWLNNLPNDLATYHPTIVTIQVDGNISACMTNRQDAPITSYSDPDLLWRFQQDLSSIFAQITATGAKVVYVNPPPFVDPARNAAVIQIDSLVKGTPATRTAPAVPGLASLYHGVSISNGVRAALSVSGKFTYYKPCLSTETADMGCTTDIPPGTPGMKPGVAGIAIRTLTGIQAGLHLCPPGLPNVWPPFCQVYSSGEEREAKATATAAISPPKPVLP